MKAKLLLLLVVVPHLSYCEIKNGYEAELKLAESSLVNVIKLIDDYPSIEVAPLKLRNLYRAVERRHHKLQVLSHRTAEVLTQLKKDAPDLFQELSNIHDATGAVTDIYVRAVYHMGSNEGLVGATNLAQSALNPNVYHSAYGDHTVSVKVDAGKHAVQYLVHELGHVHYQVPHLDAYVKYYRQHYRAEAKERGHLRGDPSHLAVVKMMKSYRDILRLSWRRKRMPPTVKPLVAVDGPKVLIPTPQLPFY